jgi:hypothetical protein
VSAVCLRGLRCVGRRSAGGVTLPISCLLVLAVGLALVFCVETDGVAVVFCVETDGIAVVSTSAVAVACVAGGSM